MSITCTALACGHLVATGCLSSRLFGEGGAGSSALDMPALVSMSCPCQNCTCLVFPALQRSRAKHIAQLCKRVVTADSSSADRVGRIEKAAAAAGAGAIPISDFSICGSAMGGGSTTDRSVGPRTLTSEASDRTVLIRDRENRKPLRSMSSGSHRGGGNRVDTIDNANLAIVSASQTRGSAIGYGGSSRIVDASTDVPPATVHLPAIPIQSQLRGGKRTVRKLLPPISRSSPVNTIAFDGLLSGCGIR